MDKPQVILITGCSSGIGRLTAQTLARQGHWVFASMRDIAGHNTVARSELNDLARRENLNLRIIELDVTDDFSVEVAVKNVIEQAGRIDVLVNNAGAMYVGITEAFTIEQVHQEFDVNFFSVIRMNRAVLPYMRKQGSGLLVHVSSLLGRAVVPFFGTYCATKFAMEALAETYHYELSKLGIDSVIVEPGPHGNLVEINIAPQDEARISGYGNLAEMSTKLLASFTEYAGDRQTVADTIAQVINTPPGKRLLRTISGLDFNVKNINEATEPIQRSLLEGAGLQTLLQLEQK
jgi:NAD(P)-dependent dehydrogenase (short-subunit alcohol dehydrogenase family)